MVARGAGSTKYKHEWKQTIAGAEKYYHLTPGFNFILSVYPSGGLPFLAAMTTHQDLTRELLQSWSRGPIVVPWSGCDLVVQLWAKLCLRNLGINEFLDVKTWPLYIGSDWPTPGSRRDHGLWLAGIPDLWTPAHGAEPGKSERGKHCIFIQRLLKYDLKSYHHIYTTLKPQHKIYITIDFTLVKMEFSCAGLRDPSNVPWAC